MPESRDSGMAKSQPQEDLAATLALAIIHRGGAAVVRCRKTWH
jgi:hypothetical protein